MGKKIIAIIGMHRSGTSVLSRCMRIFGAELGDKIIDPGPDNPKGYWEDEDILNLNIEMLSFLGTTWDSIKLIDKNDIITLRENNFTEKAKEIIQNKTKEYDFFALKDPRMAKLMPIWKEAFTAYSDRVMYIIAIRNPVSVIKSLKNRNKIDPVTAALIWISHVIPSLIETQNDQRIIIDYDLFLDNPQLQINRISEEFKLPIDQDEKIDFIDNFLDKNLRNSFIAKENINDHEKLFFLCKEVYMNLISKNHDNSELINITKVWTKKLLEIQPIIKVLNDKISKNISIGVEIDKKESLISNLNNKINSLINESDNLHSEILKRDEHIITLMAFNNRTAAKISDIELAINNLEQNTKTLNSKLNYTNNFFNNKLDHTNELIIKKLEKNEKKLERYHLVLFSSGIQNRFKQKLKFALNYNDVKTIRKSGLFDHLWYASQIYAGVSLMWDELLIHYIIFGSRIRLSPHPLFNTKWYIDNNSDLNSYSKNLLLHYLNHGEKEGRNPCPYFFPNWYRITNVDVQSSKTSLLQHYIQHGEAEGRKPNPYFFPDWYLTRYPDVAESGTPPLTHYQQYGEREGRLPCPLFLPCWYRHKYLTDDLDNSYPLHHFIEYGEKEGKNPNPHFWTNWYAEKYHLNIREGLRPLEDYLLRGEDCNRRPNPHFYPKWYLENNPDVKKAKVSPLQHFVHSGANEGRDPGPFFDSLWYRTEYPQIELSGMSPFEHYLNIGKDHHFSTFDFSLRGRKTLPIACHYVNSNSSTTISIGDIKIVVHIHIYTKNDINIFIEYLNNIKFDFDIVLTISSNTYYDSEQKVSLIEIAECEHILIKNLNNINNVYSYIVPDKGIDIASFLIIFKDLHHKYDIFGHFFFNGNSDDKNIDTYRSTLDCLLSKEIDDIDRTSYIFNLLQNGASIVFPKSDNNIIKNKTEWMENHNISKNILYRYFNTDIDNFPNVFFAHPLMFWANRDVITKLTSISIAYENFSNNSDQNNSNIESSIKNILPILGCMAKGKPIQLIDKIDSIQDYRFYEDQNDYSEKIVNNSIKILSLYLPQFHRTPENDLWHGQGFTEWTKVKSSNPLYNGHYQQHIPHEDIGYYELTSPEILAKQSEMMKKSGIYGQIFYHYWFSGKLILEAPAQMLLENINIEMPFCFCWANENWTKRWDGDEENVLLEQNYSPEDARDFIRYLIPFFKDERYIKIDNARPLLFIYRPNSIPNPQEYINIWVQECLHGGINAPYVIATLTRGATNPHEFGMDAGLERILHDWAGGNLTNIKDYVQIHDKFDGNILLYDHVVDYYIQSNKQKKKFTYFQSLVPTWDNTARYGKNAYILHGSTPEKFQYWLEDVISSTQNNLTLDKQFIVINAWNEWAEGDHLEPDTKFGYSYLNCIGRALSEEPYYIDLNPSVTSDKNISLYIKFSDDILRSALDHKEWFDNLCNYLTHLTNKNKNIHINSNNHELLYKNNIFLKRSEEPYEQELTLNIQKYLSLPPLLIDKLIQSALKFSGFAIIPISYGSDINIVSCTTRGTVEQYNLYDAACILYPKNWDNNFRKPTMLRPDAFTICNSNYVHQISNEKSITTIVRFHKNGNFEELERALLCLLSMEDCIVLPYIAAQDLDANQRAQLDDLVDSLHRRHHSYPIIRHYTSPDGQGDLRSMMLNESLRNVNTQFAAFLDYDDLLMPHAYSWLIDRLTDTNKAIAFARVYLTEYISKTGQIIKRYRKYNNGKNYKDLFESNFAPIHSFVINLHMVDLSKFIYRNDQKYMEDYCLLLQLCTENNCDWKGVQENFYIGDYMHAVDKEQTLALIDDKKRNDRLNDPSYIRDDLFILDIKEKIKYDLINKS